MSTVLGITFAAPQNVIFFPLVCFVVGLIFWHAYKKRRAYNLLAVPDAYKKMFIGYNSWRQPFQLILSCIALSCLMVVLLRPQWGKQEQHMDQQGRHLFVALDVSRSMLAGDLVPSRLEVAKRKIRTLLKLLNSERVGLILFSGEAFVQCPLTSDERAFSMFLDHVDAHIISSGTTALDAAVKKALNAFQVSGATTKLLVVFTDGEDFSSDLMGIKAQAQQEKLHIFTVGVGTQQGGPIPLFDSHGHVQGHQKDDKGSVVISCLNEGILKALAIDCGGVYVPWTTTDEDMNAIATQVAAFEKELLGKQSADQLKDRYHYWALASFFCLLLEWIL